MEEHRQVYKRYSMQIKRDNLLLIKQKDPLSSRPLEVQSNQPQVNIRAGKGIIIFKPSDQQDKLEPAVSKMFQEYLNKTIQSTKNAKIFNEFMNHQKTKGDKKRKAQKIFTSTSVNLSPILQNDKNFELKMFIKKRSTHNYSPIEKNDKKQKLSILDQSLTDPILSEMKLKPLNFIVQKNGKQHRLNKSTELGKILNTTFNESIIQKTSQQFHTLSYKLEKEKEEKKDCLKIQSSILVDRKTIPPLFKSIHLKRESNNEDLKKSLKKKIDHGNKVFEQIYKEKIKSSIQLPKSSKKVNFLDFMNPVKKQEFTLMDLIKVSLVNSMIDDVKFNMSGCFFSAYVQEGNNSDLVKSMIQRTNGWRVSETIEISNFVWTQNYRRNLTDKKPRKIVKEPIFQEQSTRSQNSKNSRDFKDTKSFLLSRSFLRKNSGSNKSLCQKSTNIENSSRNYPELSLLKPRIQLQQSSYEKQLRKLVPQGFMFENYVLKSQKDAKILAINSNLLIHNHLNGHRAISDKKNLLFNLRRFYISQGMNPFDCIPQSHDIFDQNDQFVLNQNQTYVHNSKKTQLMKKEVWIVKPGEDSNRGRGIVVCKGWEAVMAEIGKRFKLSKPKTKDIQKNIPESSENLAESNEALISSKKQSKNSQKRSIILQRYIMPLLYQGRKFDIRSYMLVTWVNDVLNGYFYEECYIRTSSKQFEIQSQNKYVHLTNDAVQSLSHDYGKYEEGNKVSEEVFSKYFETLPGEKVKLWDDIKSQMSQRCRDILKSSSKKLVGRQRHAAQNSIFQKIGFQTTDNSTLKMRQKSTSEKATPQIGSYLFPTNQSNQVEISFELFGLDFMIDQGLKLWLIEVNTNPAITHDCSRVLNRLIPKLLDNTFALSVMPFMRPSRISQSIQYQNRYHHIYQEKIDL